MIILHAYLILCKIVFNFAEVLMVTLILYAYYILGVVGEGQIRLVGGLNYALGRIQIRHNNVWGTICDDGFRQTEANVACRQLGFLRANSYGYFGAGFGPIWLDDLRCNGFESSLANCYHRGWGIHNCGHSEDIGVNCHDGKKLYNFVVIKNFQFLILD